MFDKLRQIGKLKQIQSQIQEEKAEVAKGGVRVVVNGKFEIEEIVLNKELNTEEQAEVLKKCLNEAMKEVQMKVAQKLSQLT